MAYVCMYMYNYMFYLGCGDWLVGKFVLLDSIGVAVEVTMNW